MPSATPEWREAVTLLTSANPDIASFRASNGLAALLLNDPIRAWYFVLEDRGKQPSGSWRPPGLLPSITPLFDSPSDVLGVVSDGTVLLLDPVNGRMLTDNIGGYRHLLTNYRPPATVRRGCALQNDRYVLHDAARPGVVSIHGRSDTSVQQGIVLQAELGGASASGWGDARLSGAIGRSCILWSPKRQNAFVVAESTSTTIDLHDLSADIASCPRGLAAIPKGKVHGQRVVRFFDPNGSPIGVMRFDRSILRIACNAYRLIVLAATDDSTYLASYVLPLRLRDSTHAHEGTVIVPPPPIRTSGRSTGAPKRES